MQKDKKYEFDNAPFMPGWWAQQLEDLDKQTIHAPQFQFSLIHQAYPVLAPPQPVAFKQCFQQSGTSLDNPELDFVLTEEDI